MTTPQPEMLPAEPDAIHLSHTLVRDTLGAMAGTLPHGFLKPDGGLTFYSFKRPDMHLRTRLGSLKERKDLQQYPGKHTAYWLALALADLDGEALPLKPEQAALKVAQLTVGDILFLLFAWQHQSSRKGLQMSASGCGVCGASFDSIRVDLGTMEVLRAPRAGDTYPEGHERAGKPCDLVTPDTPLRARVGLYDPMPWDDAAIQTLLLGPARWIDTFYKLGAGQLRNNDVLKAAIIRAQIVQMLGCPLPRPTSDMVGRLLPDDVNLIDEAAGQITPSPDLQVEIACPNETCSATNTTVLDWQSPAFFGVSSTG